MTSQLPPIIAAFIQAQNDHDSSALAACFADDAVVYDDEQALHGTTAIQQWSDQSNSAYNLAVEVVDVAQQDNQIVLTTSVSGTFDGSPLQFRNHFTLRDDKIATLSISL